MAYKDNCLENVIFRIDFVNGFNVNALPVQKVLLESFPIIETEEMQGQEISNFISEDGTPKVNIKRSTWINHYFWDRQKTKRFAVSQNSIYIDIKKYDSYTNTKKHFTSAVEAIKASSQDAIINRIGMRYINRIDLTNIRRSVWSKYINKKHLDAVMVCFDEMSLVSSVNSVELSYNDFTLRFNYGFLNPDKPSVQRRHIFTIDLDAFTFGEMNISEVTSYLDEFHTRIESMFEAIIGDSQRKQMGENAHES
ncbi:MAG: hypothetical protein CVV04_09235 [Firmicutes bacterium HGW-Firmicutes-9]|jgi:uncharacterized protein (TIGR04255 family)|nr:MAG: hypothetical protein CVV04_09235 [Firmicutes bacterium HGW-Firmicutes-9]